MSWVSKHISTAVTAYTNFRGIFCIYKPPKWGYAKIIDALKRNIMEDLNIMHQRPISREVTITGSHEEDKFSVIAHNSFADNPLVVGPRFQMQNIHVLPVAPVIWPASGVVICVARPNPKEMNIKELNMVRTYHIDCLLGLGTDNHMTDGIVQKTGKCKHVTPALMQKVCARLQSSFHNHSLEYSGISDPTSQRAFELAEKGLIKPNYGTVIGIHSIKCLDLSPPKFTLEVQVTNEDSESLLQLIAEIGYKLRTPTSAERLRCVRYGPFTAEDSLLMKQWRLENILENILELRPKADQIRFPALHGSEPLTSPTLRLVKDQPESV